MNKIPTICFEDIYEFCEAMDSEFNRRYYASKSDESVDISIFAKYDNARKIINLLTNYDYELVITLCARISNHDTPEIWVEPAKRKDGYLLNEADATYIFDECNRALLPQVETDKTYFVELKEDIDDEYDDFADDLELGNCYDCCCHHDCVDCDMDDEEYVNVTLPKEDIETLHMLCRIFKV